MEIAGSPLAQKFPRCSNGVKVVTVDASALPLSIFWRRVNISKGPINYLLTPTLYIFSYNSRDIVFTIPVSINTKSEYKNSDSQKHLLDLSKLLR